MIMPPFLLAIAVVLFALFAWVALPFVAIFFGIGLSVWLLNGVFKSERSTPADDGSRLSNFFKVDEDYDPVKEARKRHNIRSK
jgi:hypothetical protein